MIFLRDKDFEGLMLFAKRATYKTAKKQHRKNVEDIKEYIKNRHINKDIK